MTQTGVIMGTPAFMSSQVSSLPTKSSSASTATGSPAGSPLTSIAARLPGNNASAVRYRYRSGASAKMGATGCRHLALISANRLS